MRSIRTAHLCLLLAGMLCLPAQASGNEEPLWELGVGIGTMSFPAWRGARERSSYVLPIPYLVYRGKRFRADREGARGLLFESPRLEVDISVDGAVPVDSSDDGARAGMDDLDPIVEAGPSVNWLLHEGPGGRWQLRLPVRAAIAVGSGSISHEGWTLHPMLNYRSPRYGERWDVSVNIGPRFASSDYHSYYYDVGAADEDLPDRPAYDARGGYSGSTLIMGASRRFDRFWVGAFMRYDYLEGARFQDSPLVETTDSLIVGLAVSAVLWQSERMVPARRTTD